MKRRYTIGFITETSNDKFQTELLSGANDAAIKHDVNLIKLSLDAVFSNYKLAIQIDVYSRLIKEMDIDGLMFLGYYDDLDTYTKVKKLIKYIKTMPLLSVGKIIDNVPSLILNGAVYVKQLVKHLVEDHHYKKIAYIYPLLFPDDRPGAFVEIMKEYGLYDERYILTDDVLTSDLRNDFKKRVKKITSILFDERKLPVDAIISMFSHEAIDLIDELNERGYTVPDDIAVTGWEEGDSGKYSNPSLTTVYYPFYELGYRGLENLLTIVKGSKIPMVTEVPGRIITKKSCGCTLDAVTAISKKLSNKKGINTSILTDTSIDEILNYLTIKDKSINKEKFFHTYLKSLKDNNPDPFTSFCEEIINSKDTIRELEFFENDIFALRAAVLQYISKNTQYLLLSNEIWLIIQALIKDKTNQIIGMNEVNKNRLNMALHEIGMDIISIFDLKKTFELLDTNLGNIKISECYLFLFNKPHKLIYAYRDGKKTSSKKKLQTLRELTIHDLLFYDNDRHYYLLHILHVHQELIGFAFFESGPKDERVYQTLSIQLSSAILGALTLDKLKNAQTEILKKVQIIKERTNKLEESNKKLEKLDNLKNEFIANITHDFRSPLMVILNTSDLALNYTDDDRRDVLKERFNVIYKASLKLKTSIDRLLDIAKMDSQGVKLKVKKVRIKSFIEKLVHFYRSSVLTSKISIINKLPPGEIDNFYSDEDKLEEILNNIFFNAVKYVDPEHGEIIIELFDGIDFINIIISDNGIGIPADQLPSIFNRFYQGDDKNTGYKGTGIGLAYSKQLVEFLKGSIKAGSEGPGKGATFTLEFKKGKELFEEEDFSDDVLYEEKKSRKTLSTLIKMELDKKTDEQGIKLYLTGPNKEEDGEFDYQKGIILIVDDNRQIRDIILEYLSISGFKNFITASDGIQGVEAAYAYRPDMVICDYTMPHMRGDEFHDEIVNNPDFKRTPFIFVTALADKHIIIERKKRGALSYLTKPIDKDDLLATVELHMKKYMDFKATLQLAALDELTGLNNRNNIWKLCKTRLKIQEYSQLSVIFIDIDHFKKINDRYGHQTGDRILQQLGNTIKNAIRSCDLAGRYGGEEFLIISPDTGMEQAEFIAKRILQEIKKMKTMHDQDSIFITASFGISSLENNSEYICNKLGITHLSEVYNTVNEKNPDWEKKNEMKMRLVDILIKIADLALYEAKSTICKKCNFKSLQADIFKDNTCPQCKSRDLIIGRDKIIKFTG